MEPFRYHAFVCTQEKPEGVPCCSAAGSFRVLDALHRELGAQGLADDVQVSSCGCLGVCDSGPVMIVYPEGTWYAKLTPADVPEVVSSHFKSGKKVARLERTDHDAMKAEMLDHRNKYLAMLKAKDAAGVVPDDITDTDSRLHAEPRRSYRAGTRHLHRDRRRRNCKADRRVRSNAPFVPRRCC